MTAGGRSGAAVLLTLAAARAGVVARRRAAVWARLVPVAARRSRPAVPAAPAAVARRLAAAGVAAPDVAWWAWVVAAAGATTAAAIAAGPGLAAAAAVIAVAAPGAGLRLAHDRAAVAYDHCLPAALEQIARGLRSGASLRQAVDEAAAAVTGPVGDDLAAVAGAAAHGVPLAAALEGWAARRPSPAVRLASAALCVGIETGGPQARAVDGVAATVRDRFAVAAEVRALSSQARASALVIGVAPLAFCAFSAGTDARTADFLFRSAPGAAFLLAGVLLDLAAVVWMARLTRTVT